VTPGGSWQADGTTRRRSFSPRCVLDRARRRLPIPRGDQRARHPGGDGLTDRGAGQSLRHAGTRDGLRRTPSSRRQRAGDQPFDVPRSQRDPAGRGHARG
jgi:hypothetical protein